MGVLTAVKGESFGKRDPHLPHILGQRLDGNELVIGWQKVGDPQVKDSSATPRPECHHLLRSLPAKLPVDDGKADDVVEIVEATASGDHPASPRVAAAHPNSGG